MRGKGFKLMFFIMLAGIVITALYNRVGETIYQLAPYPRAIFNKTFTSNLEQYVSDNLPFRQRLLQLQLDINLFGGQKEQNGIFISGNGLMKNIDPPIEPMVNNNTAAIERFAAYCRDINKPVYLMLIPTASAVLQQNLPQFSSTFNQRDFIDGIYNLLSGKVTSINAYQPLLERREQYIYYRTEDNLTSNGGYTLYSAIAPRLLGTQAASLGQFDISYIRDDYYGNIYQYSPYKDIKPDILAAYHYNRFDREYTVTHIRQNERKTYHTLYPVHLADMGEDMSIYLGGLSAVTEIRSSTPTENRLLIFGDKTALAYVPFLASHYRQITIVNLFYDASLFYNYEPEDYDQIMFAYGVESFMSTNNPSRCDIFIPEDMDSVNVK